MTIPATAWRNAVDGNTVLVGGDPWPWQFGSDDVVPFDLSAMLDSGESVSDPSCSLRRIPAFGESDYQDAPGSITGTTVNGTTVLARLANLERGRYYKLDVLAGAAGNRRGGNTIVRCSG